MMRLSRLITWYALVALSAALALVSCKEDPVDDPLNPEQPENPEKPDRPDQPGSPDELEPKERVSVSSGDFTIDVSQIGTSSAVYDLTPADREMMYIHFLELRRDLDEGMVESDEDIFEYDMEYFGNVSEAFGVPLVQVVMDNAKKGDQKEQPLRPLVPETEYVLYAYGVSVEGDEVRRVTDVTRCRFLTFGVEKSDVAFGLDYRIHGPEVVMTVDPGVYSGSYFFDTLEGTPDRDDVEFMAAEMWSKIFDMFTGLGYGPEEILSEGCSTGKDSYSWELKADREYTGFAFALNEDAQISSNVSFSTFRTEKVGPSENVLTITVDRLGSRTADVHYSVTNDDPYASLVFLKSDLEGMTDEDILSYCADDMELKSARGERTDRFDGLNPMTEYSAIAYGCWGGVVTTGLTRLDFRTAEVEAGKATIRVDFDDYYDILEISGVDSKWVGYDQVADVVLPVDIVTDPADIRYFYYAFYDLDMIEAAGDRLTPELAKEMLGYLGRREIKKDVYWLLYDVRYQAVAMVEDEAGNLSDVWFSEEFVLTRDGVGDPQVFVDSEYNDFDLTSASLPPRMAELNLFQVHEE